ncbi:Protoporphyrinogen IX oxidase, aerobic, HemY [hydrothermal vent metagenome]|uniref:Protoporphyrinogen IX oxidase, aerobic, HemY n=1 Tax=hydrothermal vent metagenome TaxID=652676 RepID=A0A3B1C316_9ZZZZ
MDNHDADVLVIGGGISGLTTAWWLAQAGLAVEVWEKGERLGGKISSQRKSGYLLERSASLLMNFRPEVSRFLNESGLTTSKILAPPKPTRYTVHQGRLEAVPASIRAMISSPVWSLKGRLRLAMEPFVPAGGSSQETVSEFISRRLGREMLEKFIDPYVAGPLASDPDQANAYSVLPRLTALEQRYGSLGLGVLAHKAMRKRTASVTEAISFQGGMSTMVQTLANCRGVSFRSGRSVSGLEPTADGWRVAAVTHAGECSLHAKHVVISTPAAAASVLTLSLDAELSSLLDGIEYAPVSVVHLGFCRDAISHALNGNGFLTGRQPGHALTGSLWMSSIFSNRAPTGSVLLTNYLGGSRRSEGAAWDDTRSISEALKALSPLLGIKGDPEMVHIDRHHEALPLYHGAYHARMQSIEERLQHLPGLHLEANYRGGVSVRDRITCGHAAAQRILNSLGCNSGASHLGVMTDGVFGH